MVRTGGWEAIPRFLALLDIIDTSAYIESMTDTEYQRFLELVDERIESVEHLFKNSVRKAERTVESPCSDYGEDPEQVLKDFGDSYLGLSYLSFLRKVYFRDDSQPKGSLLEMVVRTVQFDYSPAAPTDQKTKDFLIRAALTATD